MGANWHTACCALATFCKNLDQLKKLLYSTHSSRYRIVRQLHGGSALLCIVSLLFAYFFLERYLGLPPCPLCILDRYLFALYGLLSLFAAYTTGQKKHSIILILQFIIWVFAYAIGLRHSWLEHTPAVGITSCIPGQKAQTVMDFLTAAWAKTADCSQITWEFLGLTLATQVLLLWSLLLLLWIAAVSRTYISGKRLFPRTSFNNN